MNFKKIFFILLSVLSSNDHQSDLEKYKKLNVNDVVSIKQPDLPTEFCEGAFEIVDEFIRKTSNLDYEILIYFDYIEGKILKCNIGSKNSVNANLFDNEFSDHNIASIHNHPPYVYTPPSDKNFGIFSREWEDYELIAGIDGLWILTEKLKDEN